MCDLAAFRLPRRRAERTCPLNFAPESSYARQNRGKETPNLYAESGTTKLTKERAYALMLEEHPEVYGAFVAQHNAKGLIATLERAGVRLAR